MEIEIEMKMYSRTNERLTFIDSFTARNRSKVKLGIELILHPYVLASTLRQWLPNQLFRQSYDHIPASWQNKTISIEIHNFGFILKDKSTIYCGHQSLAKSTINMNGHHY